MKVQNNQIFKGSPCWEPPPVASSGKLEAVPAPEASPETAMMDYLKNKYQNINFDFRSFANQKEIKQYGAAKTGMANVTIDPELLKKMSTDEALRKRVENALDNLSRYQTSAQFEALLADKKPIGMGLVFDEDGEMTKWVTMQEKEKQEQNPPIYWRADESTSFYSTKKKKEVVSYKYSQSTSMMLLAGAKSISSVRSVISAKYSEMQKVRAQVTDQAEAARIIGKIKTVIQKGNLKISRLHKEENIERLQRTAQRRQKAQLEKQLSEELRRKRTARTGEEHCQTADIGDILQKPPAVSRFYQQATEQYTANMPSSSAAVGIAQSAPQISVEVSSAPTVSVDCSA